MSSEVPKAPSLREALRKEVRVVRDLLDYLQHKNNLKDLPRGKGQSVFVIPGYLASDASTWILRRFLKELNYRVDGWGLGRNRGNVEELLGMLNKKIDDLAFARGERIRLVGWSLGGFLAREIAREHPDKVHSVVSMGSPLIGGAKYTVVARRFKGREGELDVMENAIAERTHKPIEVPLLNLFSKNDGIVNWQASLDHDSRHNVLNIEVTSSHLGFGFHVETFRHVARFLA